MERGDPFTDGGQPDDPRGTGANGPDPTGGIGPEMPDLGDDLGTGDPRASMFDEVGMDEGGLPLRGWVPPDDRLWLHPSEIAKQGTTRPAPSAPARPDARRSERRAPAPAVAAAAAAVSLVLVLLMGGALPGAVEAPASTASTSLANAIRMRPAPAVAALTARLSHSLVGLVVDRHGTNAMATAVAMAPGDLLVTSVSAVNGATRVTAVTPGGHRLPAHLVGSDATSGVAVLRVAARLTPAHFAGQLSPGELAMIDCLCASPSTASPSPTVTVARVDAVGVQPDGRLLDTIEADHVRQASWGTVLTDSTGAVKGILYSRGDGHGARSDLFVPGWLASAVAQQLATSHQVVHGWLGVTGAGTSGCTGGAVVERVLPGGPAAQALHPGEVVVAVDGQPVCDWAELQASLYVMRPRQQVDLQVIGPQGPTTVAVALSATPG